MSDTRRARHRRATLASVGALLATAVSLAAAAPASAQFQLRTYITQGNASGGWIDVPDAPPGSTETKSIGLFVNGDSPEDLDDAARALCEGFEGAPDPTPPSFDFKVGTAGASGGSVRLLLRFSDGGSGELRPVTLQPDQWTHVSGDAVDWDTNGGSCGGLVNVDYAQVLACHSGATITGMELVNDSGWLHPGGFQILVDNVTYAGQTVSQPAPPVLGQSVNVTQVSGQVVVRRGTGRNLARIEGTVNFPVGSVVDTRQGHAEVLSSKGGRRRQKGNFTGGLFRVKQPRGGGGLTDLILRGSIGCAASSGEGASASSGPKARAAARRRHLWSRGTGSFRTRGRYSAGSVRGTKWLTEDRCNGTLTFVQKGVVEVHDFVLDKTVFVTAGHSYFASAG
jgi:hypothetical protein